MSRLIVCKLSYIYSQLVGLTTTEHGIGYGAILRLRSMFGHSLLVEYYTLL